MKRRDETPSSGIDAPFGYVELQIDADHIELEGLMGT